MARIFFILALAPLVLVAGASGETDERIEFVRQLPVSRLEAGYPDEPLDAWLREQVGPESRAAIAWEVNDCGEGANGMICVEAAVPADDGFSLHLNVLVAGDETKFWMLFAMKRRGYRTLDVRDFRSLAAALEFLRGGDEAVLVHLLTKTDGSLRQLSGPPEGDLVFQECPVSFSLAPDPGRMRVAPVSVDANAARFSAWWEIDPTLGLPAPTGEMPPLHYSGDALAALIVQHPLLAGPWWFSSNAAHTVEVPLLSASFRTLPINGERKLTLEFGIEAGLLPGPSLGALATPAVPDFHEWPIRESASPALLEAVGAALKDHGPENAKLTRLLTIGPRIVLPVWSPAPLATTGIWIDGYGRPSRVPGMPAVWRHEDGTFGAYVRAFDMVHARTALLHRREGLHSARDSYFVLWERGFERCGTRTIGSD